MKQFFSRMYASPLMLALRSLVIAPVAPMRLAMIARSSQIRRISPSHRQTVVRSRD
jgi:predicted Co/Zn/Cd cation transporter (cation efflux family)